MFKKYFKTLIILFFVLVINYTNTLAGSLPDGGRSEANFSFDSSLDCQNTYSLDGSTLFTTYNDMGSWVGSNIMDYGSHTLSVTSTCDGCTNSSCVTDGTSSTGCRDCDTSEECTCPGSNCRYSCASSPPCDDYNMSSTFTCPNGETYSFSKSFTDSNCSYTANFECPAPKVVEDECESDIASAGEPCGLKRGNFVTDSYVDFTLHGLGPDIVFSRIYDSHNDESEPLGVGWRHSYSYKLEVPSGSDQVIITTGKGNTVTFYQSGGTYYPMTGSKGAFEDKSCTAPTECYEWTQEDGSVYRFEGDDTPYPLVSIADINGKKVKLSYSSGKLEKIYYDDIGTSDRFAKLVYSGDLIDYIEDDNSTKIVDYDYTSTNLTKACFNNCSTDYIQYIYSGDLSGSPTSWAECSTANGGDGTNLVKTIASSDQGTTVLGYVCYNSSDMVVRSRDESSELKYTYSSGRTSVEDKRTGKTSTVYYDGQGLVSSKTAGCDTCSGEAYHLRDETGMSVIEGDFNNNFEKYTYDTNDNVTSVIYVEELDDSSYTGDEDFSSALDPAKWQLRNYAERDSTNSDLNMKLTNGSSIPGFSGIRSMWKLELDTQFKVELSFSYNSTRQEGSVFMLMVTEDPDKFTGASNWIAMEVDEDDGFRFSKKDNGTWSTIDYDAPSTVYTSGDFRIEYTSGGDFKGAYDTGSGWVEFPNTTSFSSYSGSLYVVSFVRNEFDNTDGDDHTDIDVDIDDIDITNGNIDAKKYEQISGTPTITKTYLDSATRPYTLIASGMGSLAPGTYTTTVYSYNTPTTTVCTHTGDDPDDYNDSPGNNIRAIIKFGNVDTDGNGTLDAQRGIYTQLNYNGDGQVTKQYQPEECGTAPSDYTEYAYETTNGADRVKGDLKQITDPSGLVTNINKYDSLGNPTEFVDYDNNIKTTLIYNSRGQVTSIKQDDGGGNYITTTDYTANLIDKITLPKGNKYVYNDYESGRLKGLEHQQSGGTVIEEVTFAFSGNPQVTTEKFTDGTTTTYEKTSKIGWEQLPSYIDSSDTNYYKYSFSEDDAAGTNEVESKTYFDGNDNPIYSVLNPGSSTERLVTKYIYDIFDRLTTIKYYDDSISAPNLVRQIDYTYDLHGNITEITDGESKDTNYVYDDFGRLVETDSPDTNVTNYSYDERGNLIHKLLNADSDLGEAGNTTSTHVCYSYDDSNRITVVDYWDESSWNPANGCSGTAAPDAEDTRYYYDEDTIYGPYSISFSYPFDNGKGRLTATVVAISSTFAYITFYGYDTRGQITGTRQFVAEFAASTPFTSSYSDTSYEYDDNGNITQIQYPSGRLIKYVYYTSSDSYSVDKIKKVQYCSDYNGSGGCTTWSDLVTDITWYPHGDIKYMKYANNYEMSFTHGKRYEFTEVRSYLSGTDLYKHQYSYAGTGNMTGIDDKDDGGTNYDETFTYDALDQIASASSTNTYGYDSWGYDDAGNRTGTPNTVSYYYTSGTNRLNFRNSGYPDYEHDEYGNIVNLYESESATYEISYQLSNQAYEIKLNGTVLVSNFYDALGQRVVSANNEDPPKLYNYDIFGRMLSEVHATDTGENNDENPVLDFVYIGNHRVALLTGQTGLGDSPCFVATAAYGSKMVSDIDALRAFRDRVLRKFDWGNRFVKWYYVEGRSYANKLNENPGWKPVVRGALFVPVAISKVAFFGSAGGWAVLGVVLTSGIVCFVHIGRKRRWTRTRLVFGALLLIFSGVMAYSVFVSVEVAQAGAFPSEEVYFFHEDFIGRPLYVSEIQDYDSDGSLLQTNQAYDAGGPGTIWEAQYYPFGSVEDDNNSIGIEIGNPGTTGIVWEVPFRFPGQYEDPELTGLMFYNQFRFYIPSIGRYNQMDPLGDEIEQYNYAFNNPVSFVDIKGLYGKGVHEGLTSKWARCKGKEIAEADWGEDLNPWHSSAIQPLKIIEKWTGAIDRHFQPDINFIYDRLRNAISTCNVKSFGQALHTLQDFYSHIDKVNAYNDYYQSQNMRQYGKHAPDLTVDGITRGVDDYNSSSFSPHPYDSIDYKMQKDVKMWLSRFAIGGCCCD